MIPISILQNTNDSRWKELFKKWDDEDKARQINKKRLFVRGSISCEIAAHERRFDRKSIQAPQKAKIVKNQVVNYDD